MLPVALPDFSQQLRELRSVRRFDEMVVEARVERVLAILLLPIPGDSDQYRLCRPRLCPEPARKRVAVHAGQSDIEQEDIGQLLVEAFKHPAWTVLDPCLMPKASTSIVSVLAASALSSTIRTFKDRVCGAWAASWSSIAGMPA